MQKKKTRNRNSIMEIVELMLKFNQLEQEVSGFKKLNSKTNAQ